MKSKTCSLSVDMDPIACYLSIHGLTEEAERKTDLIYRVALPRMLSLFARLDVKATFFVVANSLRDSTTCELLQRAIDEGHEIGNHSNTHPYCFQELSAAEQQVEIERAHQIIEEKLGVRPVGFRAPGYNLSNHILQKLVGLDYLYDSSIFPCPPYYAAKAAVMARILLSGSHSGSSLTNPLGLLAPLQPYRPSRSAFWRPACASSSIDLWEVPMAVTPVLRMPFIGTFVALGGQAYLRTMLPLVRVASRKMLNFELHGVDLLDASIDPLPKGLVKRQPDLSISLGRKLALYEELVDRLTRTHRFIPLCNAVNEL